MDTEATQPNTSATPLRVNFISLGCPKNLIDSEMMLAHLVEAHISLVSPDDCADVTIINTCGFIAEARHEAYEAITQALEAKKTGQTRHVIVTGCLAQYQPEKLKRRWPSIDALLGLGDRKNIAQLVRRIKKGSGAFFPVKPYRGLPPHDRGRLRLTDRGWAYLRISEGCDRQCSFCTIPRIRGPYRSKPPAEIIAEAAELIADGAAEINLIGQETTSYGSDLGYAGGLARLLGELNQLEGLRWLRLLYAHPATLTTQLMETMAECNRVIPYIDLPIQHINDRILKLMHRRIDRVQTERLLENLRRTIDNLTIRTTMLVGFPSETEQEFEELWDFVRNFRFEALGAFIYSPEADTPAARLEGAISQEVKQQRHEKIMLAQQEIAFEKAQALVGQTLNCLICHQLTDPEVGELKLNQARCWRRARHPGQAPEVDSECYLTAAGDINVVSGNIVPAVITERRNYDLVGKIKLEE